MTRTSPLEPMLLKAVLRFLEVDYRAPTLDYLDELVDAYTRHVPWESVFRIAKRAVTAHTADCPRWPVGFWHDAMHRGGGGTCFESNYAFFSLLRTLGYEGYLTINDMGETCGCHTASIVELNGERWLVDVGIPLYVPIPLSADATTQRESLFHTYTITPQGDGAYEIGRDRHPKPYIFTLIDRPVADTDYRAAVTADYDPGGHFLEEVIVSKVIDGHIWRFNGRANPPVLESFGPTTSASVLSEHVSQRLAERFGMEQATVEQALRATGNPRPL